MAQEVFFSVCYGDAKPPQAIRDLHTFTPAMLHGHCRHRVLHADYPAVVPEKGHCVRGVVATGLTDANMVKLDYFEGSEYVRKRADVKLLQKYGEREVEGATKTVWVYIFIQPDALTEGEWDFEEFRRQRLRFWARGDWRDDQGMSVYSPLTMSAHS